MVDPQSQTTTLVLPITAHRMLRDYAYERRVRARPPQILKSLMQKHGIYVAGWHYDLATQEHATLKIWTPLFIHLQKVQKLLNVPPYNLSVMDIVVGNLIIHSNVSTIGIDGQMIARVGDTSTPVTRGSTILHYSIISGLTDTRVPELQRPAMVNFEG